MLQRNRLGIGWNIVVNLVLLLIVAGLSILIFSMVGKQSNENLSDMECIQSIEHHLIFVEQNMNINENVGVFSVLLPQNQDPPDIKCPLKNITIKGHDKKSKYKVLSAIVDTWERYRKGRKIFYPPKESLKSSILMQIDTRSNCYIDYLVHVDKSISSNNMPPSKFWYEENELIPMKEIKGYNKLYPNIGTLQEYFATSDEDYFYNYTSGGRFYFIHEYTPFKSAPDGAQINKFNKLMVNTSRILREESVLTMKDGKWLNDPIYAIVYIQQISVQQSLPRNSNYVLASAVMMIPYTKDMVDLLPCKNLPIPHN